MNPARAKSFRVGPFKNFGQSEKVAKRSEKFTYSGYCHFEGVDNVGGGMFFTGMAQYSDFSSFPFFQESDRFHEKLALESISHDAGGKQSKEQALTLLREN